MNYDTPHRVANNKRILNRRHYFLAVSLLALLSLVSCKKDSNDEENEKPEFNTCVPVMPTGRFSIETDGKFVYHTSGGAKLVVDLLATVIASHDDYAGFTLEFWGSINGGVSSYYHENMNGTHLKDRVGNRRTLIFPDGAKVTWYTETEKGPVVSLTIYDHGQVHHINPACHTLEYSVVDNAAMEKALDEDEADGETATFEFTATGLKFSDIYQEDVPGQKVMKTVPIGEIFRANPGQVADYW